MNCHPFLEIMKSTFMEKKWETNGNNSLLHPLVTAYSYAFLWGWCQRRPRRKLGFRWSPNRYKLPTPPALALDPDMHSSPVGVRGCLAEAKWRTSTCTSFWQYGGRLIPPRMFVEIREGMWASPITLQ